MPYRKRNRSSKRHHRRHSKKYSRSRKTYKKSKRVKRRMYGGSGVTLSNQPYSLGYSTGGNVTPNTLALANPAPYTAYAKCGGV